MEPSPESERRSTPANLPKEAIENSSANASQTRMRWATLVVMIILAVYWVILFYGTHIYLPPDMLPGNSDKVIHCAAYAVLGVLLMSLRATRGAYPWTSIVARWFVLAVYGAFDEVTQMFVNRTTDLHDWYADIVGAALGLIAVTLVIAWFRGRTQTTNMNETQSEAASG